MLSRKAQVGDGEYSINAQGNGSSRKWWVFHSCSAEKLR